MGVTMATKKRKTGDRAAEPGGGLATELVIEITRAFFLLRAAGSGVGAVNRWGGGRWGLMRALAEDGPQTVPQLARARPVARQRIQKIVDELAAEGLVELRDNPAHRRSRLVALTPAGAAVCADIGRHVEDSVGALLADLRPREIRSAVRTLRVLREGLAAGLPGLDSSS